jgi:ABC-type glycerol-3-phosphate transport system permease component
MIFGIKWRSYYFIYAGLILLVILTYFPFAAMVSMSFKTFSQYSMEPIFPTWPLHLKNYDQAFHIMLPYILNNIIVVSVSVSAVLLFGSFTAFIFARYVFPGKNVLWLIILGVMSIPIVVLLVPLFMLTVGFKILNTYLALILPYSAHQSLVILVLTSFIRGLPEGLFEAARLDGANILQLYRHLVLPLALPAITAMAIFEVWWFWNDYIWPSLVLSKPEIRTVVLGLVQFHDDLSLPEPGQGMAASIIASLPLIILFLLSMRKFITGMTAGAVKM